LVSKRKEKKNHPDKEVKKAKKGKTFDERPPEIGGFVDIELEEKKTSAPSSLRKGKKGSLKKQKKSASSSSSSDEEQRAETGGRAFKSALFNSVCQVEFGLAHEQNPAHRPTMEDEHVIIPSFGPSDFSFCGVYDGHGGRQVVELVKQHLHQNILKEMQNRDVFRSPEEGVMKEVITSAFIQTDSYIFSTNPTVKSGCTAVVSIIFNGPKGRELYIANCGDSRAVLMRKGKAVRLSYDHKGSDSEEEERIKEARGMVIRGKVAGILGVTRAFGDFEFKEEKWVIPDPHISHLSLEKHDKKLLLACDGVFDVMSDQEAMDIVMKENDPQVAAANLVKTALSKGSKDNISALVVNIL